MTTLKDLVGETVINDIENVTHALKLQELVKEKLKQNQFESKNGAKMENVEYEKLWAFETKLLQSLVKESER